MNGVEILAAHEVMTPTFNWYVFVIGVIIVVTTVIFLTWKAPICVDKISNIFIAFIVILAFTFPVAVIAAHTGEKIPYYTEDKVQLSDEVPIADFLSTYEIIGQEGQILTIREKEFDK